MEFLTAITGFVSTAAGKAVAGTAIAAATAGGLHAAAVVELPVLPDRGGEEVVETDDQTTQTEASDAEVTETEATETEADTELETENEGLGVDGATVAEDAQDGGVEGQDIAREAIAGTPAEDRVPAEFGPGAAPSDPADQGQAPEDAGSADPTDRGSETPAAEQSGAAGTSADPTDRGTEPPAGRP